MSVTRHYEVKVYLIRYNIHVIFITYLAYLLQFPLFPHPADWIVGTAEDEQLDIFPSCFGLKIIKIYIISVATDNKFTFNYLRPWDTGTELNGKYTGGVISTLSPGSVSTATKCLSAGITPGTSTNHSLLGLKPCRLSIHLITLL